MLITYVLIAQQNNSAPDCSCPPKIQVRFELDTLEYGCALSDGNGVDHDLVFIDQPMLGKLGQNAASSLQRHNLLIVSPRSMIRGAYFRSTVVRMFRPGIRRYRPQSFPD